MLPEIWNGALCFPSHLTYLGDNFPTVSGHLFPRVGFKLLIQQRSLKFAGQEQKPGIEFFGLSLLSGLYQTQKPNQPQFMNEITNHYESIP